MTISYIIPAYNAASTIRECVSSILAQEGCNDAGFEVIVVDDGSTDATAEICQGIADSRVRVLTTPNGGPSAARNAGLDAASGRYVAFVDADDTLSPDFACATLQAMAREQADIAAAPFCGAQWRSAPPLRGLTPQQAAQLMLYQTDPCINCSACGKLFSRSLFATERFTPGMRFEDLEAMPRIFLKAQRIAVIDKGLYHYRHNASSFINTYSAGRLDSLKATSMIAGYVHGDPALERAAAARRFAACCNVLAMAAPACGDAAFAEARRQCWQQVRRLRRAVLADNRARATDRLGALLSYLGLGIFGRIARLRSRNNSTSPQPQS